MGLFIKIIRYMISARWGPSILHKTLLVRLLFVCSTEGDIRTAEIWGPHTGEGIHAQYNNYLIISGITARSPFKQSKQTKFPIQNKTKVFCPIFIIIAEKEGFHHWPLRRSRFGGGGKWVDQRKFERYGSRFSGWLKKCFI